MSTGSMEDHCRFRPPSRPAVPPSDGEIEHGPLPRRDVRLAVVGRDLIGDQRIPRGRARLHRGRRRNTGTGVAAETTPDHLALPARQRLKSGSLQLRAGHLVDAAVTPGLACLVPPAAIANHSRRSTWPCRDSPQASQSPRPGHKADPAADLRPVDWVVEDSGADCMCILALGVLGGGACPGQMTVEGRGHDAQSSGDLDHGDPRILQ